MSDSTDRFVLDLDASPEQAAALRDALAETPALAAALAQWQAARRGLRDALDAAVPDRELLVLAALSGETFGAPYGGPNRLDAADRARLDAALPALRSAVDAYPGIGHAIRRIRADAEAFDVAWDAAGAAPVATPGVRPRRARAADRTAAPARRVRLSRRLTRLASLAAVVIFAGILTMLAVRDGGWQTLTADTPRTVRLADGSTADLAAGAVLMVPQEAGRRQARLRAGEATFRIQHDPSDPFTVQTTTADIVVLGTIFKVDAGQAETEVTLLEGKVSLAPREQPALAVTLAPGQRSTVLAADPPTPPETVALDTPVPDAVAGEVVARGEPLASVADRLGALFGVRVSVAPALAGEPVSGTFSSTDGAQASFSMLARTLGARVEGSAADGFRIAE